MQKIYYRNIAESSGLCLYIWSMKLLLNKIDAFESNIKLNLLLESSVICVVADFFLSITAFSRAIYFIKKRLFYFAFFVFSEI